MKMKIYAAGGTGTNLGKQLINRGIDADIVFIDTSDSNGITDLHEDSYFLYPNMDGSGMVQSANDKEIAKHIPKIMNTHPPGDINIVLFGTAGGSGSVIGPRVMSYLLDRGDLAIAPIVTSFHSTRHAKNTVNTLRTLYKLSAKNNTPVIILPESNGNNDHRNKPTVDANLLHYIESLRYMTSGNNPRLDSSDVGSWLRYDKVTDARPSLSTLHIVKNNDLDTTVKHPISVISLIPDNMVPNDSIIGYHCDGDHGNPEYDSIFTYAITTEHTEALLADAVSRYNKLQEVEASRPEVSADDIFSDIDDSDGISL